MHRALPCLLALLAAAAAAAAVFAPPPACAAPAADGGPVVRVRLFSGRAVASVTVRATDGPVALRLGADGSTPARLATGTAATLARRGPEVKAEAPSGGFFAVTLHAAPVAPGGAWTLQVGGERRRYTGTLVVQPDARGSGLLLVNEAPLEDYVASVVASEYGLDDVEGAKAMAVVARTYGLRAARKFDGDYDHADTVASQVYGGLSAVTPAARAAAEATAGEVLTYDGALIEAVYFSSSGGHTANNEDVWDASAAVPYLRGKADPYDTRSPHRSWTTRVDRRALLRQLTRYTGAEAQGFVIAERSAEGRVRTVEVLTPGGRRTLSGNTFRRIANRVPGANVKSAWFDARKRGETYVLTGRGFGHGVGMSQYGAHAMAREGADYRRILRFYYTGTTVAPMDAAVAAPALAAQTRSTPALAAPPDTSAAARRPAPRPPLSASPPPERTSRRIGW